MVLRPESLGGHDSSKMGVEKIGLFGGSFDPIHLGHLQIAKDLNQVLQLDRFIFVPALRPLKRG